MAAASIKRYAADQCHRIELHDLVVRETERLAAQLTPAQFPFHGGDLEDFKRQVQRYEAFTGVPIALFAQGCYWTGAEHHRLWLDSLQRVASARREDGGNSAFCNLRFYPALMLLYSGGIASVASGQYDRFAGLVGKVTARDFAEEQPLIMLANVWKVVEEGGKHVWAGMERHIAPTSTHLHQLLREHLKDLTPGDDAYNAAFDTFEYLAALVYADINRERRDQVLGPVGRFGWKRNRETLFARVKDEANAAGDSWSLFKSGLFGSSLERFLGIKMEFDKFVRGLGYR